MLSGARTPLRSTMGVQGPIDSGAGRYFPAVERSSTPCMRSFCLADVAAAPPPPSLLTPWGPAWVHPQLELAGDEGWVGGHQPVSFWDQRPQWAMGPSSSAPLLPQPLPSPLVHAPALGLGSHLALRFPIAAAKTRARPYSRHE